MSQRWQGLFLFYEWMEVLEMLPPKTAMTVLHNVLSFQRDGVEPPALRGNAGLVQSVILSQVSRAKKAALYGSLGAESKRKEKEVTNHE